MAVDERASAVGHRPTRPRLRWVAWAGAAAVGIGVGVGAGLLHTSSRPAVLAAEPAAGAAAETWAAGARPAPDFRLTDEHGRPVSLAALRGKPVIVTFIDPLCRNFCPIEAQRLNNVVKSMPAAARPAIVAVSVNIYGNSRANLRVDRSKWRLVPQWRWAVGEHAALARVWKRYAIGVLVTAKKIAGVRVHDVSHTEAAYLVDRDGYERALFMWPFTAADVERSLRTVS